MMKKIILTGRDGRPSMKNVYSKMKEGNLVVRRKLPNNKIYYRVYSDNRIDTLQRENSPKFDKCAIIIRWGTQEVLDTKNAIVYNKASVLSLVSNKFESRKVMAKSGVNVPLNVTNATNKRDIVYPVIARPFHHSKGKNFIILKNYEDFIRHYNVNHRNWYYSNFVDKVKEFRVHCAHGE